MTGGYDWSAGIYDRLQRDMIGPLGYMIALRVDMINPLSYMIALHHKTQKQPQK